MVIATLLLVSLENDGSFEGPLFDLFGCLFKEMGSLSVQVLVFLLVSTLKPIQKG